MYGIDLHHYCNLDIEVQIYCVRSQGSYVVLIGDACSVHQLHIIYNFLLAFGISSHLFSLFII